MWFGICWPPSPNQNDHRMDYLVSWKQSPWANLDVIQRPLLSQIGHLTVTLGTFGKWDAITHGLSVCPQPVFLPISMSLMMKKRDKDSSSYRTYLFDFDYSLWRTNWKWRQVVGRYLAYKKMIEIVLQRHYLVFQIMKCWWREKSRKKNGIGLQLAKS